MDFTVYPSSLKGTIQAIPSKSQAHRYLICAAFSDKPTTLHCPQTNEDIQATAACLNALGAKVVRTNSGYQVSPIAQIPEEAVLPCGESGSTLRFMLPIAGALGVKATFLLKGRLPQRPLSPLWELMLEKGCVLSRPTPDTISCCGKLTTGKYIIDGSVSSQFITGLLFALPLLSGESQLEITGKIESRPYIHMTRLALSAFGIPSDSGILGNGYPFHSPGEITVEGDWSNAAFFLAASALGHSVEVDNLNPLSPQGDRAAAELIPALSDCITIDAADIPDLVPILSIVASSKAGATFTNIGRLRLKESDRVATVAAMLQQFGAQAVSTENELTVSPARYHGCTIDAVGDHRIAMSAAIAATVADGPVTILGAQCVSKSYPAFWEEFRKLGGHYE